MAAPSPDAILHLAGLHALASAGFASTSRAASTTLSGVLARYLQLVAGACAERAALAGRNKVAAADVVDALDSLGVGGVGELMEWSGELEREVTFNTDMGELEGYLRDGLVQPEGVQRFYVPVDSDEESDADADADAEESDREGAPAGPIANANGNRSASPQNDAKASSAPASPTKIGSPVKVSSPLKNTPINGSPSLEDAPGSPKHGSPLKTEAQDGDVKTDPAPEPEIAETAVKSEPADVQMADGEMEKVESDKDAQKVEGEKDAQVDGDKDEPAVKSASAEDAADADADKHSAMDVDEGDTSVLPTPPPSPQYLRVNYRPRSPDMSWLPPLPTADIQTVAEAGADLGADTAAPAPQSIADRYRRPVAYRSSQLAETRAFLDPPKAVDVDHIPDAPSSFPFLVEAYETTATEPSVALRQTDGRRQAADLLRLTVGNPDRFSTRDTLAQPLPPPQVSPIVPSHSDTLPSRLIPVNPNQNGIISSILHQIRSPYLPPVLRERLTSLRPPQAQTNDSGPVLFGDPVRGADDAHLAKARGKSTGEEPMATFRATWDSGPKGSEKWTRGGLPTGRKVIKQALGAGAPRQPGKGLRLKIADRNPSLAEPNTPAFSPATTLKLRLGARGQPQGTPTVERSLTAPSPLGEADGSGSNGGLPIRLFPNSVRPGSTSPKKRRTPSPSKRSPVRHEPMQLD